MLEDQANNGHSDTDIKLRTKKGQSVKLMAIKTLLARWKKSGRIARIAEGQWKQLK